MGKSTKARSGWTKGPNPVWGKRHPGELAKTSPGPDTVHPTSGGGAPWKNKREPGEDLVKRRDALMKERDRAKKADLIKRRDELMRKRGF